MFVAQSLGLLIGATVTNMKTALSLSTVIVLTVMLVAGFYVQDIPVRAHTCLCSTVGGWVWVCLARAMQRLMQHPLLYCNIP